MLETRLRSFGAIGKLDIGDTIFGGTANSVLYIDANGNIAQDNADFSYDGTNRLTVTNATITTRVTTAGITFSSGFTEGSIPYVGASGVLSEVNGDMFYKSSSGQVGIGTVSPTTKLTANVTANGSTSIPFSRRNSNKVNVLPVGPSSTPFNPFILSILPYFLNNSRMIGLK